MYRKLVRIAAYVCLVSLFVSDLPLAHAQELPGESGAKAVDTAGAASGFADMSRHWAAADVSRLAAAGLVNGYADGAFHPDQPVTRAEWIALLDRVFGYAKGDAAAFTDVQDGAWYADALARARAAGIADGYADGRFEPQQPVTRQDAAVLLARAFRLSPSGPGGAAAFVDASEIAAYAKPALEALLAEGAISGYDGQRLLPQRAITRAETATLLAKLIGWISSPGAAAPAEDISGNAILNRPGAALKDVTVTGRLYVTEGVGEGEAGLDNVRVSGETIISGGGTHSVEANGSQLGRVMIDKRSGPVRLALDGKSSADAVMVKRPAELDVAAGAVIGDVQVEPQARGTVIRSKGAIGRLHVLADGVQVNGQPVAPGTELELGASPTPAPSATPGTQPSGPSQAAGGAQNPWQLVWSDEFNGETIDTSKWNVEDTGVVYNNELEYYSPNNARIIKDGTISALELNARSESIQGRNYSSGKLTSKTKGDWTYGKYVVRAKLPVQQGMWPAIWMMPTDEFEQYGPWPGSGEIDIMELTGPVASDPDHADQYPRTVHGTLHFDMPHASKSDSYMLPAGQTFADAYHEFALEWLPGVIRMYVDGHKYFETGDWGTKKDGQPEYYTYPAPFDRPFYMILNLAVGGDMPGSPKADFVSDHMYVDYVRVYKYTQMSKLPDVTGKRPQKSGVTAQRDPLPDGNQVYNGQFAGGAGAGGVPTDWQFLLNANGAGSVQVVDDPDKGKAAKVTVDQAGDQLYSLQLTQMPFLLEQGKAYKVTFDAKADAPRSVMSKLTEFQGGWTAYSGEVTKPLTTDWQSYEYVFNMTKASDNNARFEFNLGKDATAAYFTNVRVTETDWILQVRQPLADGNLIYNGSFDLGADRMAYWQLDKADGTAATARVSNDLLPAAYMMDRKLQVAVTNGGAGLQQVAMTQAALKLNAGSVYQLKFDAKADRSRQMAIALDTGDAGGAVYPQGAEIALTDEMTTYTRDIEVTATGADQLGALRLLLGGETGTVSIDNVSLIKRNDPLNVGSYLHLGAAQIWGAQGVTLTASGENGKDLTGMDEGDYAEYKVIVDQPGRFVPAVRVSSAASDAELKLTLLDAARQPQLASTLAVGSTGDTQTYKTLFADSAELTAGAYYVRLTGHGYNLGWLDLSRELVDNGDFAAVSTEGWTLLRNSADSGVQTTVMDAVYGELRVALGGPGAQEYDVQVKQEAGKPLEAGKTYRLSFDAYASTPRDIKALVQFNGAPYTTYMERIVSLTGDKQHVEQLFTMSETNPDTVLQFSLGKIGDISVAHDVYLDHVSLVQTQSAQSNMLENGDFNAGITGWTYYSADGGQLAIAHDNGALKIDVGSVGGNSWDRQVYLGGISYTQGHRYTLTFKARATTPRKMNISVGWSDPQTYAWTGYGSQIVDVGTSDQIYTFTFDDTVDTTAIGRVSLELGNISGGNAGNVSVWIDDIRLVNDGPTP
ncbi:carbohydrate binding domain-containing protein [Paenibacillus athensensis]|uniref:carbohydrate binding domain-containing protein n=1 Tax=Paenibacillus athensensis TaxID=1967502 RepID=UPI00142F4086|nr:carbohydrate binding domain-containing protein [Paenibacillus athensensis]MCD1259685.1 carbohydrate binding domain-containing protein [Paenibacillus athensensis]